MRNDYELDSFLRRSRKRPSVIEPERGTGRTTKQITEAPRYALYVMPNKQFLCYAGRIRERTGRGDLTFTWPEMLERWSGVEAFGVVVDHAAVLTTKQKCIVDLLQARAKPCDI
jgi:hypothetical protein